MKRLIYIITFLVLCFSSFYTVEGAQLQQLGRWDDSFFYSNVLVHNNKAYCYDDLKIVIIDVSNPSSPQRMGDITLSRTISDLYVSGNYAYATTFSGNITGGQVNDDGLHIISISNSNSPQEVAFYKKIGLRCVYVTGKYAYIGSGYLETQFYQGGFDILDISIPSSPKLVGAYSGSGIKDILAANDMIYGVYLDSSRVYSSGGIISFDISQPDSVVEVERYQTYSWTLGVFEKTAYPEKIVRSNNFLFLTTQNPNEETNSLMILDTTTWGSMEEVSTYESSYFFYGHYVSGTYLYVVDGDNVANQFNLKILDISNPVLPVKAARTYTGKGPLDVYVTGDTVYAAEGSDGLAILSAASVNVPPIGTFEIPVSGTLVRGSIAVSGWVLDDKGVDNVKLYRSPGSDEGNSPVFLGDAVLVEGARPDVELAFPSYPMNSRAGWGYMLLTNYNMPNQGNGPVTLTIIATDSNGMQTTLGSKTVNLDNANAEEPFGAIDLPSQGGIASGSDYLNWGWALTPQPNTIPIDGSTIDVLVDGVNLGHPVYNLYRKDVAEYFPGYNNSNGAVGYFYLDTTKYTDGVHTISWNVEDDAGNANGIGSRYFTIQNSNNRNSGTSNISETESNRREDIPFHHLISQPHNTFTEPVEIIKGYRQDIKPLPLYPDANGNLTIELEKLDRIEIRFQGTGNTDINSKNSEYSTDGWYGIQTVAGKLRTLPIGSFLDKRNGIFYWQPGPAAKGLFKLVFIKKSDFDNRDWHILRITINII